MSTQDTLAVVLASDVRGWLPMNVAVWSLVETAAPTTTYDIYLLEEGITEQQQQELRSMVARAGERHTVTYIDVSQLVANASLSKGHLPQMAWARIYSPALLPDVHKALYVDIDTVICTDLKPLFDTPLEGKAAGVVLEVACSPTSDFNERLGMPLDCIGYFNSGVILMNLDFFREQNLMERVIAFSAAHPEGLRSQDQDALNAVLYPYVVRLHPRWNWNDGFTRRILKASPEAKLWRVHPPKECIEAAMHPGIVHFIGPYKPWKYNHRPGRKIWEQCLLRSGIVDKLDIPGWNLRDFVKRILYTPIYALTDMKIRRLAKRWGIK